MDSYQPEIHRSLDNVEVLEQLKLDFHITEEEYRSSHDVSGKVRGSIIPDSDIKRARGYPPVSIPERVIASVTESESLALETGYPGTHFYAGLVRNPPVITDEEHQLEGRSAQVFSVEDIPDNGTVELGKEWELEEVKQSLSNDEHIEFSHEYSIEGYPSEHLPIVIRGNLHRDAREYLEKRIKERTERKQSRKWQEIPEQKQKQLIRPARRYEGYAVLSIVLEYRGDAPEAEVATDTNMIIDSFRADMESTFADIEFLNEHKRSGDYTYNPEKKRVEWRNRRARPGSTVNYDIVGPISDLINIGHISASFRGKIRGQTLTGTRIRGLYDKTGQPFNSYPHTTTAINHTTRLTGTIEVDPTALAGDTTTHTTADIQLDEHPEQAFDQLEAICQREGVTILDLQNPGPAEPVRGQEGVFEIRAGESGEGDDRAGRMEVKREFGNEGVVYADIQLTGKYTAMSKQSEVSAFEDTEDRVIRTDEGGLDTRGKTTVEIRARSSSSDLNTDLINRIKRGLKGLESRDWGPEREDEERLRGRQSQELPSDADDSVYGNSDTERELESETSSRESQRDDST